MKTNTTVLARVYFKRPGYAALQQVLDRCREIYNAALQERREVYGDNRAIHDQCVAEYRCAADAALVPAERAAFEAAAERLDAKRVEGVSYREQSKHLTAFRAAHPDEFDFARRFQVGALQRLDRAFQAFFRRVKNGETPGYPRFKPDSRFNTLESSAVEPAWLKPSSDGRRLRIRINGLPTGVVRLKRPLPEGKACTLKLTRRATGWWLAITYEVEMKPLKRCRDAVGIDVGVAKRMALSNGDWVEHREVDRSRENALRQKVSRRKKGGKRRRKAVKELSRETFRNAARNRNALHQLTTNLVRRFGLIAVEDLRINNMTRSASGTVEEPGTNVAAKSGLNRSILEQTWGILFWQFAYKAEWAGRRFIQVPPHNTSRTCAACGAVDAASRVRERFRCVHCGYEADADYNAAAEVLERALAAEATPPGGTAYRREIRAQKRLLPLSVAPP